MSSKSTIAGALLATLCVAMSADTTVALATPDTCVCSLPSVSMAAANNVLKITAGATAGSQYNIVVDGPSSAGTVGNEWASGASLQAGFTMQTANWTAGTFTVHIRGNCNGACSHNVDMFSQQLTLGGGASGSASSSASSSAAPSDTFFNSGGSSSSGSSFFESSGASFFPAPVPNPAAFPFPAAPVNSAPLNNAAFGQMNPGASSFAASSSNGANFQQSSSSSASNAASKVAASSPSCMSLSTASSSKSVNGVSSSSSSATVTAPCLSSYGSQSFSVSIANSAGQAGLQKYFTASQLVAGAAVDTSSLHSGTYTVSIQGPCTPGAGLGGYQCGSAVNSRASLSL